MKEKQRCPFCKPREVVYERRKTISCDYIAYPKSFPLAKNYNENIAPDEVQYTKERVRGGKFTEETQHILKLGWLEDKYYKLFNYSDTNILRGKFPNDYSILALHY